MKPDGYDDHQRPIFKTSSFVQSVLDENMMYVLSYPDKFGSTLGPKQDFIFDNLDGLPVVMTLSRGFEDRGVMCVEYRPAYWIAYTGAQLDLRVRFYNPGVSGCSKCQCNKKVRGEDCGL